MNRIIYLFCLIFLLSFNSFGQEIYNNVYLEHRAMLEGKQPLNFKKAIFTTENAYYDNQLNYEKFCKAIEANTAICKSIKQSFDLTYPKKDKNKTMVNASVFKFMTDTTSIYINDTTVFLHLPFQYNFEDFAGAKDWSNMFVTKLIETRKGNCHSLPILYKMIVEEMGERAWLSFAPNHLYIKLHNEQVGWYNTELTCAEFPTDAWLMSSGYIHIDAIRNGIYMDTLSLKQSVALCLVDLAQGYQAKYGIGDGSFILQCCDAVLEHFPNYINALLLKAETMASLYKKSDTGSEENRVRIAQMNELYTHIHGLGYRKMPHRMYLNWLNSMGFETVNYRARSLFIEQNELK